METVKNLRQVWANRFNEDGTIKPIGEWWKCNIPNDVTHIATDYGCGWPFKYHYNTDSDQNFIEECGSFGLFWNYEYIGNQRGDGWFYIADGDLPPYTERDETRVMVLYEVDGIIQIQSIFALTHYKHNIICWQPIQKPDHNCNL